MISGNSDEFIENVRKIRSRRAVCARRREVHRRVAREVALRAVGDIDRRVCGRRSSSACLPGSAGCRWAVSDWHGTKLALPNSSTRSLEWECLPWKWLTMCCCILRSVCELGRSRCRVKERVSM